MKKIVITVILALSILFVFAGCGERTATDIGSDIGSSINSAEDKMENGMTNSGNDNNNNNNNSNNNNSNSINSNNNNNMNTGNTDKISKDEAKKIAFKHANVNESDAYDISVDLENDNGISSYEVDFETKSAEYDYHINIQTGEIITSSKEDKANSGD